jgi:hypothetical protein
VVGSVPPADIGKASGSFSMMRQLGGAFGIAIAAAVFATAGGTLPPTGGSFEPRALYYTLRGEAWLSLR